MTALERAKAFVNSRAAKTALKIMPLALATVVTVGHPQKAQAGTLNLSGGSVASWINGGVSGGAKLGQPGLDIPADIIPPNDYNGTGSEASGTPTGSYVVGTSGKPFDLAFFISGNGTFGQDDLSNPAYVEAIFNMTCDTSQGSGTPCAGETYTYTLTAQFDQLEIGDPHDNTWAYTDTITGTFTANGSTNFDEVLQLPNVDTLSCQWTWAGAPSCPTTLTNFNGEIDFGWTGSAGEYATFPTDLIINAGTAPNSGPPAMPEPASLLLALSGLPLVGRFIRRKK